MAALIQPVLACLPYASDRLLKRRFCSARKIGKGDLALIMWLTVEFKHDIATGARRSMIAIGQKPA